MRTPRSIPFALALGALVIAACGTSTQDTTATNRGTGGSSSRDASADDASGGGGAGGLGGTGGASGSGGSSGAAGGSDAGGSGGGTSDAGDAGPSDAASADADGAGGSGGAPADGGTGGSAGNDAGGGGAGGSGGTGGNCTPPVSGTCNTFPQCGCGTGQTCNVTSLGTGATTCVPVGTGQEYGACKQVGECAAGLECLFGVCVPFCSLSGDCAGRPGRVCQPVQATLGADGGPMDTPGMKVCTAQCPLEKPESVCGAGIACVLLGPTGGSTDCIATGGTTADGADCTTGGTGACTPGDVCVQFTGTTTKNVCRHWCRVGYPADCPVVGSTCETLTSGPIVGTYTYGICCPAGGC